METSYDNLLQMARLEFRSNHNIKQATKNVRRVFGFHSIDLATMRNLYRQFEKENVQSFKEIGYEDEMAESLPTNTKNEFPQGMISQLEGDCLFKKVVTIDGRFGFDASNLSTSVIDLFTGESREFPNSGYQSWPSLFVIDKEYLIAYRHSVNPQLILLKYDLKAMTLKEVHKIEIHRKLRHGKMILDQSGKHSFFLYNRKGSYMVGKIEDDKIFTGSCTNSDIKNLRYPSLVGNCLLGIRYLNLCWYYFKLDLETSKLVEFSSIPYTFNGKKILSPTMRQYVWSGSRLYVGFTDYEKYEIFVFDNDNLEWDDTGLKFSHHVQSISVNSDEVLTMVSIGASGNLVFHRLPLKKPDSLMNIAWFALMRRYGKEKCKKILDLLPSNCHLRFNVN